MEGGEQPVAMPRVRSATVSAPDGGLPAEPTRRWPVGELCAPAANRRGLRSPPWMVQLAEPGQPVALQTALASSCAAAAAAVAGTRPLFLH